MGYWIIFYSPFLVSESFPAISLTHFRWEGICMAIPWLCVSSKALANHPNRIFLKHYVSIHHLL